MKVLFQSDDYGITKGQARGAIEAVRNGVIRNTGFFTNMPWHEEVYEWIKPYLHEIAFGIDLNTSTGPSVLGHDACPTLTHENGTFLGSKENRALDNAENGFDHLVSCSEELYAEFDAQIQRFIALTGKKPDYIHNHAYGTKTTDKVTHDLAVKYGCISTASLLKREEVAFAGMGWYLYGKTDAEQLNEKPLEYLTEDKGNMLSSHKDYGFVISHCGYADEPLFELTSFTLCRTVDLACMTSDELKQWIYDHNIEVISFHDLPREWIEKA